jgi:hypothetical protein
MSEVSQRKLQERYNRVHVELLSLLGQSVSRIKELSAKHKTLKDQILDAHHSHNQAVSDLQEARAMLAAASQRIDENARELNFKQKERAELEAELEAFHNKTRSMEKKIRELKEKLADDKTFEGQCRLQLAHIAELNGLIEHVRVSLTWSCHGLAVCLTRRPFAARNPTLAWQDKVAAQQHAREHASTLQRLENALLDAKLARQQVDGNKQIVARLTADNVVFVARISHLEQQARRCERHTAH